MILLLLKEVLNVKNNKFARVLFIYTLEPVDHVFCIFPLLYCIHISLLEVKFLDLQKIKTAKTLAKSVFINQEKI